MRNASIKVMIGRNGKPRIMEETGDSVKVYSHEQWAEELKRREGKKEVKEEKIELPDLIEEDTDEEALAEKPTKKVSKGVKAKEKSTKAK